MVEKTQREGGQTPTRKKSVHVPAVGDVMETPAGSLIIEASPRGIQYVGFENQRLQTVVFDTQLIDADVVLAQGHICECKKQLQQYFGGERKVFDLTIDAVGTAFQQQVWQELTNITFGQTVSYLDIALSLNNPKAVRAVGAANGNNPISIIVPCHRVIGSNRSLTGYAGGLTRKSWLLDHEKRYGDGPLQGELLR